MTAKQPQRECADTAAPALSSKANAPAAHDGGLIARGATSIIPQKLITDGEVVLLALKPSLWFILLVSVRWLVGAALTIVLVELLRPWLAERITQHAEQLAVLAAAVRLIIGSLEWLGRVYVLTDRRVMRLRGVMRIDLFECPLSKLQKTELALPMSERVLGCGTVLFSTAASAGSPDAAWQTLAQPARVYRTVLEAIERYRGQNGL